MLNCRVHLHSKCDKIVNSATRLSIKNQDRQKISHTAVNTSMYKEWANMEMEFAGRRWEKVGLMYGEMLRWGWCRRSVGVGLMYWNMKVGLMYKNMEVGLIYKNMAVGLMYKKCRGGADVKKYRGGVNVREMLRWGWCTRSVEVGLMYGEMSGGVDVREMSRWGWCTGTWRWGWCLGNIGVGLMHKKYEGGVDVPETRRWGWHEEHGAGSWRVKRWRSWGWCMSRIPWPGFTLISLHFKALVLTHSISKHTENGLRRQNATTLFLLKHS